MDMVRKTERKGLGRGLSALLAETGPLDASEQAPDAGPAATEVPIEKLRPNPDQPRRDFSEQDLAELAASISQKGVIQPLLVRVDPDDASTYQIIAGERRWRAAQRAQRHQVPVIVREHDDEEVLEIAIIENVQRVDLNAVEEARGYRQLMDRFGHTQERLAEVVGKSRSHIANALRLLTLPAPVLELLRSGALSAGHARALVTARDPVALARQVVKRGLSVRQTEALARNAGDKPQQKQKLKPEKDADTRAIEADLTAHLRLKVSIEHKPGGEAGELRIRYRSLDELDGLCRLLSS